MALPLEIPSCVSIGDVRLRLLYCSLKFPLIVTVIVCFFVVEPWRKIVDASHGLSVSISVAPLQDELLNESEAAVVADMGKMPMCMSPSSYHYKYDSNYHFQPTGCLHACALALANSTLVTGKEGQPCEPIVSLNDGGEHSAFVTTLRRTRTIKADGNMISSEVFSPLAANTTIRLKHHLHYEKHAESIFSSPVLIEAQNLIDVLTVVVRKTWQEKSLIVTVRRVVLPGVSLEISIDEALEIAGLPADWLDAPDFDRQADSLSRHPRGRVTGAQLSLSLECGSNPPAVHVHDAEVMRAWSSKDHKAVCTVTFSLIPGFWGVRQFVDSRDTQTRGYRWVQDMGISLRVDAKATFDHLDITGVMLYLVFALVLLKIPKILVTLVIRFGLGRLSHIYGRLIARPFSIESDFPGVALRAMLHSISFDEIDNGRGSDVVSGAKLKEQLRKVFGFRDDLRTTDVEMLVDFIYDRMFKISNTKGFSRMLGIRSRFSKNYDMSDDDVEHRKGVSFERFDVAMSRGEPMEFMSIVRLFDVNRRRSILERLFTPPEVMNALSQATPSQVMTEEEEFHAARLKRRKKGGRPSIIGGDSALHLGSDSSPMFSRRSLNSDTCDRTPVSHGTDDGSALGVEPCEQCEVVSNSESVRYGVPRSTTFAEDGCVDRIAPEEGTAAKVEEGQALASSPHGCEAGDRVQPDALTMSRMNILAAALYRMEERVAKLEEQVSRSIAGPAVPPLQLVKSTAAGGEMAVDPVVKVGPTVQGDGVANASVGAAVTPTPTSSEFSTSRLSAALVHSEKRSQLWIPLPEQASVEAPVRKPMLPLRALADIRFKTASTTSTTLHGSMAIGKQTAAADLQTCEEREEAARSGEGGAGGVTEAPGSEGSAGSLRDWSGAEEDKQLRAGLLCEEGGYQDAVEVSL
eukprot:TRINITY_DN9638_c0_g1_i1.p1 TRINITY_DN9638_c0_g1~~TRINITY_DN9638_c0_g1_i1.p1  ORF type:complete len:915 (-),score=126.46 TRINITY_DN9638_c0_g1_i1:138-2882(-)